MHAWLTVLLAFLAVEIPPLTGRVVDLAGLLTEDQRRELEARLAQEEEHTSVQIVVATLPTIEDEPLEDFSVRLAEAWRIGQKGLDNGAVILVVQDQRRVRLEVGYGLEAVLPDGVAGRIIREQVTPRFADGDFYGGLTGAVDGIIFAARTEYPPGEAAVESEPGSKGPRIIGGLIFAGFGWLIVSAILRAIRLRPWLASGLAGAVFLPLFVFFGGWLTWVTSFIFAPLGFLLGALVGRSIRVSSGKSGGSGSKSTRSERTPSRTSQESSPSSRDEDEGFSGGGGKFGGGGASGRW